MPAWPSTVPFIEDMEGFTLSPQEGSRIRTNMSAGPAKQRRRSSAVPINITGKTSPMTEALYQVFATFYHDTLGEGSLSFTADHPTSGVNSNFRFISEYTLNIIGDNRVLTLNVENLGAT